MKLKLYMMFEGGVSTQEVFNPHWGLMSRNKATVYFRPDEETHAYIGELFLKGYAINFTPFNGITQIPDNKTVFFLVHHKPEGLWIDGKRWAEPAKGTRVR